MKKLKATNLEELCEELIAIDQECADNNYEDGFDPQHIYDATSLPTFGGEEPDGLRDTDGIFSWDKTHFMVNNDEWGWRIYTREDV